MWYIHTLVSCYYFRLHSNAEKNALKSRRESKVNTRKRRHNLRKVLLTLDYGVECIGCSLISLVFFVGDRFVLQRILLTLAAFVFGVPIPIAYLLNESRVRNVIISKGWIRAFISIFDSPEKIKRLERKRIVSYLLMKIHPGVPKMPGSFIPAVKFPKFQSKKYIIPKIKKKSKHTVSKSLGINDTKFISQSNSDNLSISMNHSSSHQHVAIEMKECVSKHDAAEKDVSDVSDDFKNSNEVHRTPAPVDVHVAMVHQDVREPDSKVSKVSDIANNDSTHDSNPNSPCLESLGSSPDRKNGEDNGDWMENDSELIERDVLTLPKSTFSDDDHNLILEMLLKKDFKVFSRTYVLKHLLSSLNNNPSTLEFLKYFNYLCYLEKFPESYEDSEINLNLIISLINAWYLSKTDARCNSGHSDNNTRRENNKHDGTHNTNCSDKLTLERTRISELLLSNVSLDAQYAKYLKELCDVEGRQNDVNGVIFW